MAHILGSGRDNAQRSDIWTRQSRKQTPVTLTMAVNGCHFEVAPECIVGNMTPYVVDSMHPTMHLKKGVKD